MMQSHGFTPPHPLNTAVLFLVFNRPDTTKQVFEAIKQAKPPRLYVAADGARDSKPGEADRVKEVRDYVMNNIDWDCEVYTLFRDENLGCKYAVSGAITWFFEREEQGIILEDDCLPSQSFFWFCEELLGYYKNDLRVWHISGDNFQVPGYRYEGDYYFSNHVHVWGWATWASRWLYYDVEIEHARSGELKSFLSYFFRDQGSLKDHWEKNFRDVSSGKIDTWDYQWMYTIWTNSGISIIPSENLVTNIGFGEDATHTNDLDSKLSRLARYEIEVPNTHPKIMAPAWEADEYTNELVFPDVGLRFRLLRKLLSKVKCLF